MLVVGVTGGLASGKTTVAEMFRKKGAYIFDADTEAKEILDNDEDIKAELISEFGKEILSSDGTINKQKLAEKAFLNEENQTFLNDLVHPVLFRNMDEVIAAHRESDKTELFIVDAALIYESGLDRKLDFVIVVYSSMRLRLERALKRGNLSRDDIMARMDLQMPDEEKRELADYIIENKYDLASLEKQVDTVYNELMA